MKNISSFVQFMNEVVLKFFKAIFSQTICMDKNLIKILSLLDEDQDKTDVSIFSNIDSYCLVHKNKYSSILSYNVKCVLKIFLKIPL